MPQSGRRSLKDFSPLSLAIFCAAVFFTFATVGFINDMLSLGRMSPASYVSSILLSGGFGIASIAAGYALFIVLMSREGARFFKLKAEMDLATEIHKQLVPRIESAAAGFEFYGSSEPSGEVGGDLVDVVMTGTDADARWVA